MRHEVKNPAPVKPLEATEIELTPEVIEEMAEEQLRILETRKIDASPMAVRNLEIRQNMVKRNAEKSIQAAEIRLQRGSKKTQVLEEVDGVHISPQEVLRRGAPRGGGEANLHGLGSRHGVPDESASRE